MAPSSLPSTPIQPQTPRRIAMSRSVTVPPKLAMSSRTLPTPEIGAAEGIETLYVHPRANIIKFTTSSSSRPSSSSGSPRNPPPNTAGTAPWRSSSETTLAAGPMEIYRVPGSVSFLHSGALLHAIMPRSQCWCVDGVSKFAFRVLPDTYYRIELPGETVEDLEVVEGLKAVLGKVLFYERTACPFARGFEVELPFGDEGVKVRKGRRKSSGPAKKWRLERGHSWKPEDGIERKRPDEMAGSSSGGSDVDEESDEGSQEEDVLDDVPNPLAVLETPTKIHLRPTVSARSVTAPMQLGTRPPTLSRLRSRFEPDGTVTVTEPVRRLQDAGQAAGRTRTYQAIPTDMPPSPPDSSAGAEISDFHIVAEDASASEVDTTLDSTPEPPAANMGEGPNEQLPSPSPLNPDRNTADHDHPAAATSATNVIAYDSNSLIRSIADLPTSVYSSSTSRQSPTLHPTEDLHREPAREPANDPTPPPALSTSPPKPDDPFAQIQARIQARRSIGGTTSFLPRARSPTSTTSNSSTLSLRSTTSRTSTQSLARNKSMTTALVSKAYSMFLGPPAHLVAMMLRIASRFARGRFGSVFLVESPQGQRGKVPGSFHLDELDDDGVEEWEGEEGDEDDFGVPLRSPVRVQGLRERRSEGGWEVD
ncbi:hypothetical protein B0A48_03384 [Cryoendolithus antarcticus]|uniref:Inheritance of peroxisomes protein 1 n=1 Tax=Cryoendolithus antarcticus TaxID=1507870 RepID=A0A1V8TJV7_9PEZI|nr:hypothetical protein B0A48_03384 [Cryoendolithus antarcticus]